MPRPFIERKIIQLSTCAVPATDRHDFNVWRTALCSDGTTWELVDGEWRRLPPIPQDDEP